MTVAKVWDGAAWVPIVGAQGPQGEPGPQGEAGDTGPTGPSGVYLGPGTPTGGEEVWIDTDEPEPDVSGDVGWCRLSATNHGAAAGSFFAFGSSIVGLDGYDTNYYAIDAVSGKALGTMVRVLVSGWYRVLSSSLQSGGGATNGPRGDTVLYRVNTDKSTGQILDNAMAGVTGTYWYTKNTTDAKLLVGEGVAINNVSGPTYTSGGVWSWISLRFMGAL